MFMDVTVKFYFHISSGAPDCRVTQRLSLPLPLRGAAAAKTCKLENI